MRILITGDSGFIGTNLVDRYLRSGDAILNLDPQPPRQAGHREVWRITDPLDAGAIRHAVRAFKPTHILHMGARTDLRGKTVEDYRLNTDALTYLLDACDALPALERVIFASSRLVCRIGYQPASDTDYCPPNAYGESKVVGEQIVRAAAPRFSWVIVRPTSIWGPWFDVPYKTFFRSVATNRYLHIKGHDPAKSFGFVGNTVHELDVLLTTMDARPSGRTLYLADYPPIHVHDMAERIQRSIGSKPIRTVPMGLLKPVALAGDLMRSLGWTDPPLTSFRLNNLVTGVIYDLSLLEEVVGDLPYSLDDGIKQTVEWMRINGEA
jgi:GlcNAc-P-P-Und epimerase